MRCRIHKCRRIDMKFPIIAWLIMIFQGMAPWKKDSWSHMVLEYESITTKTMIVDSTGDEGVHDKVKTKFLKKYKIIETHEFKFDQTKLSFYGWVEDLKDTDYDQRQVWGLALKAMGLLSFNKYGHNYMKLICSELILNYMEYFDIIEVGDPDDYSLIDTWDLAIRH